MRTTRSALCLMALVLLSGCSKKAAHPTAPAPDTQGPSPVSDLRIVSADTTSILLAWTAPLDNGTSGVASYELREALGTGRPWASMTPVSGLSAPRAPGQAESFRVGSLAMGSVNSFTLRSTDGSGNVSADSNTPHGPTAETTTGADLIVSTSDSGIWYSLNAGRTWHQAAVTDQRSSFGILAPDPSNRQVLYASSTWGSFGDAPYLYRSTDEGADWSALPTSPAFVQNGAVDAIVVAPSSPRTIYVGVRGHCLQPLNDCADQAGGAYRSTDGGLTWQDISAGLPTLSGYGTVAVYALAVDPSVATNLCAGVFRSAVDAGYFASTTAGSSWGRQQSNPPSAYIFGVAIDPSNAQRIVITAYGPTGIYLCEGGLISDFTLVSNDGGNQPVVFDPTLPSRVYTASEKSVDGPNVDAHDAARRHVSGHPEQDGSGGRSVHARPLRRRRRRRVPLERRRRLVDAGASAVQLRGVGGAAVVPARGVGRLSSYSKMRSPRP